MQPGRWEFQKLSRRCLWGARAERLCSQGVSSGSVRAVGLSAAGTHTCWALPIPLRQAFRSLLLDGGLSGRGLASGTSHSHTWHQAPRRVSLCQCHAKPSEGGHPGHRLLGFPSAARASLCGSCGHPEGPSPRTAPFSRGLGPSFLRTCGHAQGSSLPAFPGNEPGLDKAQLVL